uniref:Uncharacterized protein n=1 Tax=Kwoniella dejecticola CBS 10117 TaxID=1296121 RepID=A0A1A6AEW4_9TREE|nr:uncharacterized protein I303_00434 [Kwoniella dejecticola CBS 10117]OBR88617.1 hypothetical protein I303_00434 [Kwoniella dejecticola CBS 10117]
MDGFPVYEDTYPPEYNQEPYLQYADDYIPEQPAYAEYEEIEGDIDILDEFEEEEDDLPEAWIPYPTYSDLLPGNGNQQVIIGASFPQAADLKQHYCDLYPEDCAKGLVERNGTISGNGTLEGDVGTGTGLNHVDLSGCGLALILLFLILLGLNSGLGGGEGDKGKARDAERPRSEKDRGQPGRDGKGKDPKDGKRKGETPEERAKRKAREEADKKASKKDENSGKRGRNGETPEEREARKAQERRNRQKGDGHNKVDRNGETPEERQKRKDRERRDRGRTDRANGDRDRNGETPEERQRRKDREAKQKERDRRNRSNNPSGETPEERQMRKDREKAQKERDRKRKDRENGGAHRETPEERQARKDRARNGRHSETPEERKARHDRERAKNGKGGKHPEETPEQRDARHKREKAEKDRKRKAQAQAPSAEGNGSKHGETPEERAARHKKAQEEKDKKRAAAKAQAEKDAKKKAAEEEAEKKKRKRDGQRSETPEERAERHKRKNETPEETAKRHKREKADREERAKRKNETPEETAARHKREKAEKANRGKGDQPAAVGDDSKSSSWLSPPLVLGLLLLLGLVALGGAGKAMQLPQGVPAWSDWRSPLPSWSDWTPPSFFHVPRTPIGGGLLNPDGGILGGIGSRSSPPLVRTSPRFLPSRSKSRWLVNEPAAHRDGPQININNVNSQGSGDPISFGSTSSGGPKVVVEEEVIVDAPPVMVQEKIWEPLSFRFTGPSNPDRLLNMLLTILLVSLPLLLDFIKDYPENAYTQPNYISSPVQLLILGALILLGLLIADYHFGWTTTIAPYAEVSIEGVQGGLTPVLVGAVETTEQLVWGLEDVLFGESRVLLGMGLAALGVFFLSQREPSLDIPETEFARPTTQALVFLGALLLGMFFWNA